MTAIFCPINLPALDSDDMRPIRLSRSLDSKGFERGERINGYYRCPRCGLWWPCVEEPDCWTEDGPRWKATGWWGAAVCGECNLLMADQPDGRMECYQL